MGEITRRITEEGALLTGDDGEQTTIEILFYNDGKDSTVTFRCEKAELALGVLAIEILKAIAQQGEKIEGEGVEV